MELIIIFILLLPILVFWKIQENKHKKEAEKFRETSEDYLESHKEDLQIIPGDYRFPIASEYLVKLFETGRADDMKEALKLLDDQITRWNIESSMQDLQLQMAVLQSEVDAARGMAAVSMVASLGSMLMHL